MKPIPNLTEVRQRLENNLRSRLDIPDAQLRTVLDAMNSVLSAEIVLIYLYLSDIQRNLYPDSADPVEQDGELNRMGEIYLNRQPRPATDGKYMVSISGAAGSVIRQGLTFKSNDDSRNAGILFVADNEYVLSGADDEFEIRSLNSGTAFLLDVGDRLTITEPVLGTDQSVEISSITQIPTESENIEDYRNSIIYYIQAEPQGGAKTDYRIWASDVASVRSVYVYVKPSEAGIVQVFVEATIQNSEDALGTPSQAILDEVKEVIEFDPDETKPLNERGRRPIQAGLEVLPITPIPVDVQILGLSIQNNEVDNLIRNGLDNFVYMVRPFVDGADLLRNKNSTLFSARLQSALTDILGNENSFLDFNMYVGGNNVNQYLFAYDEIPYIRNITYV